MDQRYRFGDDTELLETLVDTVRARVRSAMPVMVAKDSKDGHTVSLQPVIKSVIRLPDGTTQEVQLPVLEDMPIHHAGGGGLTSTVPHKSGDEGWIIPSAVAIDDWHQQGGIKGQGDARSHAISDGVYVPGVRSDPRKLKNVSTTSAQTRTDDHKTVSDWSDKGVAHVRGQAIHNTSDSAISSALSGALHTVSGSGVAASKGGSSHVVVEGAVSSLAPKVLLNC